jgi:hypothetical protein
MKGNIVGTGVHQRKAPQCMVRFRCPDCGGESILDAYMGVPHCPIDRKDLEPISVVRDTPPPEPKRKHALKTD